MRSSRGLAALSSAIKIVQDGGAGQLARMLHITTNVPDKHTVNLITTRSMVQRTSHIERVMNQELSLTPYQRENTLARCGCLNACSIFQG